MNYILQSDPIWNQTDTVSENPIAHFNAVAKDLIRLTCLKTFFIQEIKLNRSNSNSSEYNRFLGHLFSHFYDTFDEAAFDILAWIYNHPEVNKHDIFTWIEKHLHTLSNLLQKHPEHSVVLKTFAIDKPHILHQLSCMLVKFDYRNLKWAQTRLTFNEYKCLSINACYRNGNAISYTGFTMLPTQTQTLTCVAALVSPKRLSYIPHEIEHNIKRDEFLFSLAASTNPRILMNPTFQHVTKPAYTHAAKIAMTFSMSAFRYLSEKIRRKREIVDLIFGSTKHLKRLHLQVLRFIQLYDIIALPPYSSITHNVEKLFTELLMFYSQKMTRGIATPSTPHLVHAFYLFSDYIKQKIRANKCHLKYRNHYAMIIKNVRFLSGIGVDKSNKKLIGEEKNHTMNVKAQINDFSARMQIIISHLKRFETNTNNNFLSFLSLAKYLPNTLSTESQIRILLKKYSSTSLLNTHSSQNTSVCLSQGHTVIPDEIHVFADRIINLLMNSYLITTMIDHQLISADHIARFLYNTLHSPSKKSKRAQFDTPKKDDDNEGNNNNVFFVVNREPSNVINGVNDEQDACDHEYCVPHQTNG